MKRERNSEREKNLKKRKKMNQFNGLKKTDT